MYLVNLGVRRRKSESVDLHVDNEDMVVKNYQRAWLPFDQRTPNKSINPTRS